MLRSILLAAGAAVVAASAAVAAETTVTMNKITAQGVGEAIGTVRFVDGRVESDGRNDKEAA